MQPEDRAHESLGWVLTVLVALSLVLTVWQHVAWGRGTRALPERVVMRLLTPVVSVLSTVVAGVGDVAFSLASAGKLGRENRALREEAARLRADNLRLVEQIAENRQLRETLNCPQPPTVQRVGVAEVIARSPGLLSRRAKIRLADGVELAKNDILISGGALVGCVLEAMGSVGEAVLIVDSQHAVAAIDRRSRDEGMLYAHPPSSGGPDLLRLDKIVGRADIALGDVMLTSGLGQVYPKGIPIGSVIQVIASPTSSRVVTALVKPLVDFQRLEFVTVARVKQTP